MAVHQEMWLASAIGLAARRASDNDRVAFGGAETGFESYRSAMVDQPFSAGLEITAVLSLCRDTGEPNVFAEFIDKAFLVLFEIRKDGLHGGKLEYRYFIRDSSDLQSGTVGEIIFLV